MILTATQLLDKLNNGELPKNITINTLDDSCKVLEFNTEAIKLQSMDCEELVSLVTKNSTQKFNIVR